MWGNNSLKTRREKGGGRRQDALERLKSATRGRRRKRGGRDIGHKDPLQMRFMEKKKNLIGVRGKKKILKGEPSSAGGKKRLFPAKSKEVLITRRKKKSRPLARGGEAICHKKRRINQ